MASSPYDSWAGKESEGLDSTEQMKAWEQHAGVIHMPRFDYAAPNSLLRHSRSAFLVTCPIKREKSATKELISFLDKYLLETRIASSAVNENVSKKRKTNDDESFSLSLVKLTKNGLLLLLLPDDFSLDTLHIVFDIFHRIETKSLSCPVWCHRILPVQATCALIEEELRATVFKLVSQFLKNSQKSQDETLKFAIGYNRRGLEEDTAHVNGEKKQTLALLDRMKCFLTAASAVKEAASNSSVDLKSPDVSILIELLPVSGVPLGTLVCAVCVLPRSLVIVKPRLSIKPLVIEHNFKICKA